MTGFVSSRHNAIPPRNYTLHEGMKDFDTACPCGDQVTVHPTNRCRSCLIGSQWARMTQQRMKGK